MHLYSSDWALRHTLHPRIYLWFLWWIWPGASLWEGEAARLCCGCPALHTWTGLLAGPCRRQWQTLQDETKTRVIWDKYKKTAIIYYNTSFNANNLFFLSTECSYITLNWMVCILSLPEKNKNSVWHFRLMDTLSGSVQRNQTQRVQKMLVQKGTYFKYFTQQCDTQLTKEKHEYQLNFNTGGICVLDRAM